MRPEDAIRILRRNILFSTRRASQGSPSTPAPDVTMTRRQFDIAFPLGVAMATSNPLQVLGIGGAASMAYNPLSPENLLRFQFSEALNLGFGTVISQITGDRKIKKPNQCNMRIACIPLEWLNKQWDEKIMPTMKANLLPVIERAKDGALQMVERRDSKWLSFFSKKLDENKYLAKLFTTKKDEAVDAVKKLFVENEVLFELIETPEFRELMKTLIPKTVDFGTVVNLLSEDEVFEWLKFGGDKDPLDFDEIPEDIIEKTKRRMGDKKADRSKTIQQLQSIRNSIVQNFEGEFDGISGTPDELCQDIDLINSEIADLETGIDILEEFQILFNTGKLPEFEEEV